MKRIFALILAFITLTGVYSNIFAVDSTNTDNKNIELIGYQMILNDNIGIKFYVKLPYEVVNDSGAYVKFKVPNRKDTIYMIKDCTKTDYSETVKDCYAFMCEVAAPQMTVSILMQVVNGKGEVLFTTTYKVYDYLSKIADIDNKENQSNKEDKPKYSTEAQELAKNLLYFGGYSQQYFKYNLTDIASKGLKNFNSEVMPIDPLENVLTNIKVGANVPFEFKYASLKLDSDLSLKFYFTTNQNVSDYEIKKLSGQIVLQVQYDEKKGMYYFEVPDIKINELDTEFFIGISYKSVNSTSFVSYKPLGYIKLAEITQTSKELRNVTRSLYNYYTAVLAYENSIKPN